jgi:hypothetical protein
VRVEQREPQHLRHRRHLDPVNDGKGAYIYTYEGTDAAPDLPTSLGNRPIHTRALTLSVPAFAEVSASRGGPTPRRRGSLLLGSHWRGTSIAVPPRRLLPNAVPVLDLGPEPSTPVARGNQATLPHAEAAVADAECLCHVERGRRYGRGSGIPRCRRKRRGMLANRRDAPGVS